MASEVKEEKKMISKAVNLASDYKKKDFLTLLNYSAAEIEDLVMLAYKLKNYHKNNVVYTPLEGKTLGMIFEKASTRTRVSFEVGMNQLGGYALFLNKEDLQLNRGESLADTAKTLSRYVDVILLRTGSHQSLVELAENATVPVINALSDLYHPTQIIADLLTIYEQKGKWKGVKLTYVGDGNNVVHSLMIAGAKLGMEITVATPVGYAPDPMVTMQSLMAAEEHGGKLTITSNVKEAVKDADIVYTDVWCSMGFEAENEQRLKDFRAYQVDERLVRLAAEDYTFMHCLPAHRGQEVSAEVIDGKHSVVFDEAENRLHAHKAILVKLLT